MIIGVQGTSNFNDYNVFLRAMGTALRSMPEGDTEFLIYTSGPHQINAMVMEFSNVSERSLKARGIKIKFFKIPPKALKQKISELDYFAFFSKPKEPVSDLVDLAEAKNLDVGVYRF